MSVPAEVTQARELIHQCGGYFGEDDARAKVEMGYAVQHMMRNKYLAEVAVQNRESVYAAMQNVASVGLTLNPAEHLAYLVPRKIDGRKAVCFDPSYQGLMRLATDSGSIKWCHADVVYDSEAFVDHGIGCKPEHVKNPFSRPGNIIGAYCVAKTSDGDFLTTPMTLEDLHKIRDGSEMWKSKQAGPWKDHTAEMMKKTVLRRAFKNWPRSVQGKALAVAVEASNQNEGYEELPKTAPDLGIVDDSAKADFDRYISEGNGIGLLALREASTEREWVNLYHSFEKGAKGKYQKIVDELVNATQALLRQYAELLTDYVASGDDAGIAELLEEMADAERDMVVALLPDDVAIQIGGSEA